MRVGLIGFGRTGRAVATVILQNNNYILQWVYRKTAILNHRSVPEFLGIPSKEPGLIYSKENINIEELLQKDPVDIIVDFSTNTAIYDYGEIAAYKKIKIISAISYYEPDQIKLIKKLSEKTTVFWSPNITLGINFMIYAAKLLQKIAPNADIELLEEHFKLKSEVSGTAKRIAKSLDLENQKINSIRAGGIVGKHEIIFGFPYQIVRLIHESIAREAFGNGAIFIADCLKNKSKGLFDFEFLLKERIELVGLN